MSQASSDLSLENLAVRKNVVANKSITTPKLTATTIDATSFVSGEVVTNTVDSLNATITNLTTENATITNLTTDNVTIPTGASAGSVLTCGGVSGLASWQLPYPSPTVVTLDMGVDYTLDSSFTNASILLTNPAGTKLYLPPVATSNGVYYEFVMGTGNGQFSAGFVDITAAESNAISFTSVKMNIVAVADGKVTTAAIAPTVTAAATGTVIRCNSSTIIGDYIRGWCDGSTWNFRGYGLGQAAFSLS